MLKIVLLSLLAILAVLLIVIATRPDDFRVTRSAVIAAPPAVVFEQFNDLHKWNVWSPWARMDPNAKYTFDGPAAGVGASLAWAGNSAVGQGKMTITESQPTERVIMRLDFVKPFVGTSTTEFTFRPEGAGTAVTWSMLGKNNFIAKAIGLVMNCEKMVGGQFEQGFSNLRSIVEPAPRS